MPRSVGRSAVGLTSLMAHMETRLATRNRQGYARFITIRRVPLPLRRVVAFTTAPA
jgi:hypothetical protein